jgi:predicted RNase H-like nuclease
VAVLAHDAPLDVWLCPTFTDVLRRAKGCAAVGVDMPIGLPDAPPAGGRACEVEARALLGRPRASSIFSTPARAVLEATTYTEACALNRARSVGGRGISKQTWGIVPKLREVDAAMTSRRQRRVVEVHPELSFRAMNGGVTVAHSKASAAGALARVGLLHAHAGVSLADLERGAVALGSGAKLDDLLDAVAAAWSARRVAEGGALHLPAEPPRDAKGLRMELWA